MSIALILTLAAKSLLVAAAALLCLRMARKRSAADRSAIAHGGLAALLLLPVGAILLPPLELESAAMPAAPPQATQWSSRLSTGVSWPMPVLPSCSFCSP